MGKILASIAVILCLLVAGCIETGGGTVRGAGDSPGYTPQNKGLVRVDQSNETRVALVIGNAKYQHTTPLNNPPNDARLMAETLTGAGFTLVGGRPLMDADKPGMERAIREFGRALNSGAVGLFYYSGHGIQIRGSNYLVPVAADVNSEADVDDELVDAGRVLKQMEVAGNRLNIVILDACRNNPFGGRGLRAMTSGLAQIQAPAGTVISYATQPGNTALDGDGDNSPYTKALAETIRQPGLSVFDTFNQVGVRVKQATRNVQQPWLATSPIEGQFTFTKGITPPPPVPVLTPTPTIDRDALYWQSIQASTDIKAFQAYLNNYPNGAYADLARIRIEGLSRPQVVNVPPVTPTYQPVAPSPPPPSPTFSSTPSPGATWTDPTSGIEFVWIPGGTYQMGCGSWSGECDEDEKPLHTVTVAGFWLGRYVVTQGQYRRVMGSNPSGFQKGDTYPVEQVSWDDAQSFVSALNGRGNGAFRLPTEAEWEYACRSGGRQELYCGGNSADTVAWYAENSGYSTHPFGGKVANGFGLYDMSGNVWEWLEDCSHDSYNGAPTNGAAWTTGSCAYRIVRGGSWSDIPSGVRASDRNRLAPGNRYGSVGFRVTRTLSP